MCFTCIYYCKLPQIDVALMCIGLPADCLHVPHVSLGIRDHHAFRVTRGTMGKKRSSIKGIRKYHGNKKKDNLRLNDQKNDAAGGETATDASEKKSGKSKQREELPSAYSFEDDLNHERFLSQLRENGFELVPIQGDGNCLFRAIAHQMTGNDDFHQEYRTRIVNYISRERDDFEPFIENGMGFLNYIDNLSELGTFGGQDCIVAFSRLERVKVCVHEVDCPVLVISAENIKDCSKCIHLAYHNQEHYSSLRETQMDESDEEMFNDQPEVKTHVSSEHKVDFLRSEYEDKLGPSEKRVFDEAEVLGANADAAIRQSNIVLVVRNLLKDFRGDVSAVVDYLVTYVFGKTKENVKKSKAMRKRTRRKERIERRRAKARTTVNGNDQAEAITVNENGEHRDKALEALMDDTVHELSKLSTGD